MYRVKELDLDAANPGLIPESHTKAKQIVFSCIEILLC